MTGSVLLAALPCAALGLALGPARTRIAVMSAGMCVLSASLASLFLGGLLPPKTLIVVCGIAAAITVVPVYFSSVISPVLLIVIAVNAGVWAGALVPASSSLFGLATALVWVALALPASWLVRRNWQIALKVAASWIVAIALLSVTLNTVSMPSYQRDHME